MLILVAVLVMLTGGQVHPAPTTLGKTSTVFQMLMVGVALMVAAQVRWFEPIRPGLLWATAALTIASGVQYTILAPRYVDWGSPLTSGGCRTPPSDGPRGADGAAFGPRSEREGQLLAIR